MTSLLRSRFFRFLVVGGVNTALNYGVYALLLFVGLGYVLAVTVSFIIGLVINFKTNARLVFDHKGNRSFLPYVLTWLALYFANVQAIGWLVRNGVNSYLAGAVMVPPIAIAAFLAFKYVVFRRPTQVNR
jgi:putative flippase GtrA